MLSIATQGIDCVIDRMRTHRFAGASLPHEIFAVAAVDDDVVAQGADLHFAFVSKVSSFDELELPSSETRSSLVPLELHTGLRWWRGYGRLVFAPTQPPASGLQATLRRCVLGGLGQSK
jgi:hypothetical protein